MVASSWSWTLTACRPPRSPAWAVFVTWSSSEPILALEDVNPTPCDHPLKRCDSVPETSAPDEQADTVIETTTRAAETIALGCFMPRRVRPAQGPGAACSP